MLAEALELDALATAALARGARASPHGLSRPADIVKEV
jgi:hypothetical protein